ncbi:MAG: hypothetical protein AAF648_08170 [Pseudomonadota bacterium]
MSTLPLGRYGVLCTTLTTLVLTAACGDAATDVAKTTTEATAAVTTSAPVASQPPLEPITTAAIEGLWRGLISCAGRNFPVALTLSRENDDRLTGEWSIEPAVNHPNYVSPDGRTVVSAQPLTGTLVAPIGLGELTSEGGSRAPALTLLVAKNRAVVRYGRCDQGLLERDPADTTRRLASEIANLKKPLTITREAQQGTCPAALDAWIQAGLALPLDGWARGDISTLWSDTVTEPLFGAPLASFDANRRLELRRDLQARCKQSGDRRRNRLIARLARITDVREYREARLGALERATVADWYERFAAPAFAQTITELNRDEARALRSVPRRFSITLALDRRGVVTAEEFDTLASATADSARRQQRASELAASMRSARFENLFTLWASARIDDDIDPAFAAELLGSRVEAAAQVLGDQAQRPAEAVAMAQWLAGHERGTVCPTQAQNACDRAAAILDRTLVRLTETFAADEAERPVASVANGAALPVLAALIEDEARLEATYGAVLGWPAFARLMKDRTQQRHNLQRTAATELKAQIDAAATTASLRQLQAQYFAPSDLSAPTQRHLKQIRAAFDAQFADSRPFTASGADDYLNALYNEEFRQLRQLDREFLKSVRPALGFLARQITQVAELFGEVGRPLRTAANELSNPTAATAVAVQYLTQYQRRYPSCLDADASVVTFNERVDTVTRTASGIELSRIRGVESATSYRVRSDLLWLFRATVSGPQRTGAADSSLELLLGDTRVTELTNAVNNIMAKHRCDSPEIRQFERGLQAYYRERQRGWQR